MAALDWSQCPAVESVPDRVGGAWVFKGTRLPEATVVENLEDLSIDDEGQLVEEGQPADLFGQPREERTQRFLGKVL